MPTINKTKQHFNCKKGKVFNNKDINYPEFYGSKGWRLLRNHYFALHPLCEMCLKNGTITPADDVHHIIPFSTGITKDEQFRLLLDENNLMSVCKSCHHKLHKKINR